MRSSANIPVVLIVDNDYALRAALSLLIQTCGWKAKACANGSEFFVALASAWPACILINPELPDIDGITVQREISRLRINVPVIALTAYEDHPDARAAEDSGARAVISKPFRVDELVATIANLINPSLAKTSAADSALPVCT